MRRSQGGRLAWVVALACIGAACGGDESSPSAAQATTMVTTGSPPTIAPTIAPTTAPAATAPAATTAPDTTPPASTVTEVLADEIPVAFTPAGGWTEMPPPVLAACTEPLVEGAPDMRGTWEVVSVDVDGADAPTHDALGEIQRIEQCGDRVVITAGGIIHDMRADGTEERGVNDVAAADFTTLITVVATFEDGVHVLRPVGVPIEVTRTLDGEQLVWGYLGFTARLERIAADP
jgi:hypothetical protein